MPQSPLLLSMFRIPPSQNRVVIEQSLARSHLRIDRLWIHWSGQDYHCFGITGMCLGLTQAPQMALIRRTKCKRYRRAERASLKPPDLVKDQYHQIIKYLRGNFRLNPECRAYHPDNGTFISNLGNGPAGQKTFVFRSRVICIFALKTFFFLNYFNKKRGDF